MLMFLASVLEQLDLALEHISKRDVHNARFGLMLTDNAVELILHQIAADKQRKLKLYRSQTETFTHQKALDKAVLRNFADKVAFARSEGRISSAEATTLNIMHEFRNEVYHVGLSHEDILHALAEFYFFMACGVIGRYHVPFLSWGMNLELPARAKKYFKGPQFFPCERDDFKAACTSLAQSCNHEDANLVAALADHLDRVIDHQNTCVDVVAGGVYDSQKTTRDDAVMGCQSWSLACSNEGRKFATQNNWSVGRPGALADYLADNYPFKFRGDPIRSWERQAKRLRAKRNGHAALAHYNSFMLETAVLRDQLEQTAGLVEAEIDNLIESARGN